MVASINTSPFTTVAATHFSGDFPTSIAVATRITTITIAVHSLGKINGTGQHLDPSIRAHRTLTALFNQLAITDLQ
jgi:hypothetical protein